MRILILSLCVCVVALANRADAHQYSFLLQNPVQVNEGPDEFAQVDFSIYLDPDKTNWIAWSQAAASNEDEKGESLLDPIVPNNYGIDDYMEIRLTSPEGKVSPTYELDRNDANNVSYGTQAFVFGKAETNPKVVRTDAQGKPTFFREEGVADAFVRESGKGYYNVSITFKNEFGDKRGTGDVFLIMDAREYFFPEPPSFQNRLGSSLPYVGNWDDNGHSSDSGDGNNDNSNRRLEIPNTPQGPDTPGTPTPQMPPVIPEPGTLILTALGLTGLANRLRRRKN